MHISYHIIAFILYKMLLMLIFLCVPRSMVWNEEEAKNPIYLRILKPKNIPNTWKHILLLLGEGKVNPKDTYT